MAHKPEWIQGGFLLRIRTRWTNTIFSRLLFTFLIIIIPLYFGGLSVYSWGAQTVKAEICNSMVAQVNSYLKELEYTIRRIEMLQLDCLNDADINKLAVIPEGMSNLEKTRAIMRLQKRLYAIKNSSEYIQNVNVYIPSLNRIVYALGGINSLSDEWYDTLSSVSLNPEPIKIYQDGLLILSVAFPRQSQVTDRKPIFIIGIELSEHMIKNALMRIDDYSGRGTLLISPRLDMKLTYGSIPQDNNEIYDTLIKKLSNKKSDTFQVKISKTPYLAIYSTSDYLDMTLCKYLPESQVFEPLYKYQVLFWIFTSVAVIIIVFFSVSTKRFIHQPLLKLVKSFQMVEGGNLNVNLEHHHDDEFRYLYRGFNEMVRNLKTLFDQVYTQRLLAQKAELKQLQSQINPHFLYNCFFSLHSMVMKGEYESVEYFTRQLGGYFQYVTRNAADEVKLSQEIIHAGTYADIQARRFRNRIKVEFQALPHEFSNIIVPRLIVQPLIENAFKHGLKDKLANGLLRIYYALDSGFLNICVEDNGDSLSEEDAAKLNQGLDDESPASESTGIINIHRRLRLKYGNGSGLKFSIGEMKGLKAVIMIKLEDKPGKTP